MAQVSELINLEDVAAVDDDGRGGAAALLGRELGMDCHAEEVALKYPVTVKEVHEAEFQTTVQHFVQGVAACSQGAAFEDISSLEARSRSEVFSAC